MPEALVEAWRGIDPASIEEDRSGIKTIVDLCRAWYAVQEARRVRQLTANTLSIYRHACEYIRDSKLGAVPLKAANGEHVAALVEQMANPAFRAQRAVRIKKAQKAVGQTGGPQAHGRGYGHRTINQTLVVLGIIWKWGREQGYPAPSILPTRFKIETKRGQDAHVYRDHTPSTDEIEAVLGQMRRTPIRLAMTIAWKAGARVGEVGGLRWGDIERTPHGWVLIIGAGGREGSAKTGTRRVALPAAVAEDILSYRPGSSRPSAHLFGASAGKRLGDRLIAVQQRQGIPVATQFTFHGLRRRWSLDQIAAGVPVSVYADMSGHSPEVALRHYARVSDQDRQAAMLRVEATSGANDVYAYLADKGLTVADAIELIDAALRARASKGEHLSIAMASEG